MSVFDDHNIFNVFYDFEGTIFFKSTTFIDLFMRISTFMIACMDHKFFTTIFHL